MLDFGQVRVLMKSHILRANHALAKWLRWEPQKEDTDPEMVICWVAELNANMTILDAERAVKAQVIGSIA